MRRRALASFTLVSFLLSIVIGAVWLRSYVQLDTVIRQTTDEAHKSEWMLAWSRGRVLGMYRHHLADEPATPVVLTSYEPDWSWTSEHPCTLRSGASTANHYGFTATVTSNYNPPTTEARGFTRSRYGFVVPCWALFGATMLLPTLHWGRNRRRSGKKAAADVSDPESPAPTAA